MFPDLGNEASQITSNPASRKCSASSTDSRKPFRPKSKGSPIQLLVLLVQLPDLPARVFRDFSAGVITYVLPKVRDVDPFQYATQIGVKPPRFLLFTNAPMRLHFSYERFLKNRLRESFEFIGTPLEIQVRARRPPRGRRR